jgi:hypothetical protein
MTLEQIEEELKTLYKQQDVIQKRIMELCNLRTKIVEQMGSEIIKEIPENIRQISDKQWKWILEKGHNEGQLHYNFCQKIIEDLGFGNCMGFLLQSHQPSISISKYSNFEKIKEGFEIIKKHLKPVTVKGHTTETGLRFEVHDLEEDTTSILYVHKKGDAIIYIDRYNTKKFKSFNEFVNWYKDTLHE